jgi:hypothetical protein
MSRLADLERFYDLLDQLRQQLGGLRTLATLSGHRDWPDRGLYLFFEATEVREESGSGPRVVRVGTHALGSGSRSTLRQRLGQHRGQVAGGGNHRGSIFRLLIGQALMARGIIEPCASWGIKGDAGKAAAVLKINRADIVVAEAAPERAVTSYISAMPFLWICIDDAPGSSSLRGVIERNSIALLSNHSHSPIDPPSSNWLGYSSDRELVRSSGLWNQRHVEQDYDPKFLGALQELIHRMGQSDQVL